MPTLAQQIREHVQACFPGLYIQTHEQEEAEAEILRLAADQKWTVARWSTDKGLATDGPNEPDMKDPLEALHALPGLAIAAPAPEKGTPATLLLIARNLHRFMDSPEIIEAIASQLSEGKARRTFLIILAPVVQIPPELERGFVVLEHGLPDREALDRIARQIGTEPGDLPEGSAFDTLMSASAGLTRGEAEGAYALSLVRHGTIKPNEVWDLKAKTLRKSGLVTIHRGSESFDEVGGLKAVKDFARRSLRPDRPTHINPKGIMLLGVPGTGKSAFAKALGNETGRPTVTMDIGSLMGSLVGQSERNAREALKIADAMSPCILFIDEIEKGLAGIGGNSDSGVATRLFGTLLTWMQDHTSDVFMVATSNDISKLPPEFTRAERFDGLFFLDFPDVVDRGRIWGQYLSVYRLREQALPNDRDWTGAEIKACCRLAALLDCSLLEAAANVVPIASTSQEKIRELRQWANGRCLSADRPGIYSNADTQPGSKTTSTSTKTTAKARSIVRPRDPEDN